MIKKKTTKRLVYKPPDLFGKETCRTQKLRPDLFSKNLFSRPNLL